MVGNKFWDQNQLITNIRIKSNKNRISINLTLKV